MNTLNNTYKKETGDKLSADTWNGVIDKINETVTAINNTPQSGGTDSTSGLISVSAKGNTEISSAKNINLEAAYGNGVQGDIALKPGDDIQFFSHHREPKKRDKVVVKNIDNSDNPVKLDVVAGEINLAVGTKNNPKTATRKKNSETGADISDTPLFKADAANVLDVAVLTGNILDEGTKNERDERAYLKVRAQAIDLRCEKHGGIALQPKGYDSDGNMNKIKFEHGGGDGLEFGTFNTEKSSLYTDEYRFKKNGIIKLATRETDDNDKTIIDEGSVPDGKLPTAAKKYVKQSDDFYDIIDNADPQCTWGDIVNLVNSLRNYELVFECQHSISDYDITYSPNVPGSASYSDLVDGNMYTKEQLQSRYLYNESFDNLKEGQIIELNIHNDSEDPNDQVVACGFIVHQRYNSNKVTLEDIIKVVEYFKNNNSTGPFASN